MKIHLRNYIYVFGVVFLLVGLFLSRESLSRYLSGLQTSQASTSARNATADTIASRYDYVRNELPFKGTFLEFGATTCHSCKLMEKVMKEISQRYEGKVKVVFVDITLPENQHLIEHFGISSIPAQVLLGREGKEYYRHTGYISADDLQKKLGTP